MISHNLGFRKLWRRALQVVSYWISPRWAELWPEEVEGID
jgi:hypothetical protein